MDIQEKNKQLKDFLNKEDIKGLYFICEECVKEYGRPGGIMAYNTVYAYYEESFDDMSDEKRSRIEDILDALTGYCADPIGEADYHLQ